MHARHVRRSLSTVVCGAVVVALTAVTSAAITPGESFDASPSQGAPFTVIAVSGTNCIGQSAAAELEDLTGDDVPGGTGAIPGANVIAFVTPDGSGNWSANIPVPPVIAAGQYRVVASCGSDAYAPQPFQVLAGELASMSTSPRQATAGADVAVDVSGTLCRDPNAQVDVGIFEAGAQQADEYVARAFLSPDSAGNWSTQLIVPAATPAGNYLVGARCAIADRPFFRYLPSQPFQLVPVVSPSFTG